MMRTARCDYSELRQALDFAEKCLTIASTTYSAALRVEDLSGHPHMKSEI